VVFVETKCPKEKSKPAYLDPPVAPVVSSVPALMVAQPAVAVPTQRLDALLLRDDEAARSELRQQVIRALAARMDTAAQQSATQQGLTTDPLSAEKIRKLEEQIELQKQLIESLKPLIQQLEQQNNGR
jgi:hypothetical protein